jgi:hypothetical protein
MDVILGSGITGCLAKEILGWRIIPFKRSRYFVFDTPWADNYFQIHDEIDPIISRLFLVNQRLIIKNSYSFKGELYDTNDELKEMYLEKIYGNDVPGHASSAIRTIMTTYDIEASELYKLLNAKYLDEINESIKTSGELVGIDLDNKVLKCSKKDVSFDRVVSTIPLDALYKYCNIDHDLVSKGVYFYHINTDKIDLEGSSGCYVCDPDIDFFKVYNVGENDFVFCSLDLINNPLRYFGMFLGYNFDIVEVKHINGALPIGDIPNVDYLKSRGIHCIGSNARWDDFEDLSSSILNILKIT